MITVIMSICVLMTSICRGMETELIKAFDESCKLFYLPAQKMVPLEEYKQLANKYDVNVWQADDTPLMQLIGFGVDNAYINVLLAHKARVNLCDAHGNTALHWAMNIHKVFASEGMYNPTETVVTLLDKGADVCATNRDGDTPLHRLYKQPFTLFCDDLIDRSNDVVAITQAIFTYVGDVNKNKDLLKQIVAKRNNDKKTIADLVAAHSQYNDLPALPVLYRTIERYMRLTVK
ncbi:MAG: ankyrin repeat domain-containing protein [Candidatus Babeliales bacterium]